jgi:hypothetical protein
MHKKPLLLIIGISFCVMVLSVSTVSASSIPEWIKNNAKWWADGTIGDADYIASLEYLITQRIITIPTPIAEVTAATSPVSDEERAQSIVVRVSGGPIREEVSFTTFSQFKSVSSRDNDDLMHSAVYKFGDKPQFMLSALPSKDKALLYKAIDEEYFAKPSSPTVSRFNVHIDVLAGDGSLIQTWAYSKCQITGYGTFLQDITNFYPFSGEDGAEFREKIFFECSGVRLDTP